MDQYNMYSPNFSENYNQETEESAPSFFMQFPYAFNPAKYGELVKTKTGAMIGFIALFLAICTIFSYIVFALTFNQSAEVDKVLDMFPDFYLANGEFFIDEEIKLDDPEEEVYVYLTDEVEEFTLNDAQALYEEGGYESIILVSHSNLVLHSNNEYNTLSFDDISQFEFDKDFIVQKLLPGLFVAISIGYIFYYIGRVFWYFICAAVYMLIAMICAKIFNKEFTSGVLFKTAVYAKVLMTTVACVLSAVNLSFAIPAFVRTMITLALILVAFAHLPQKNHV